MKRNYSRVSWDHIETFGKENFITSPDKKKRFKSKRKLKKVLSKIIVRKVHVDFGTDL